MKRSRFTEGQIAHALKQSARAHPPPTSAARWGGGEQTFHVWLRKYGAMGATEVRRVCQLEEEVKRPKHLVADLSLDKHIFQEVLANMNESETLSEATVGAPRQGYLRCHHAAQLRAALRPLIDAVLPDARPDDAPLRMRLARARSPHGSASAGVRSTCSCDVKAGR